ncbi:hypothetical protein Pelo_18265 [Pelomyxa schiedti]|nr:hypothetical protein Pelo_18265 [Pelomyxa schiedti]
MAATGKAYHVAIPPHDFIPKQVLSSSHFLVGYNRYIATNPSSASPTSVESLIFNLLLDQFGNHCANAFRSYPGTTPQKLATLYSSETSTSSGRAYFRVLNDALIQDAPCLEELGAIFWHTNRTLVCQSPSAMTLYRGSHMVPVQQALYKNGQIFRQPTFVSTSTKSSVANGFSSGVVTTYRVPSGCPNVGQVTNSVFSNEAEWILPPYTRVRVINNDLAAHTLELEVLDNKGSTNDTTAPPGYMLEITAMADC